MTQWAAGLGYESFAEQWISYTDRSGIHFAQPDWYCPFPEKVLLLEAKLTQSDSAEAQCAKLYVPLLERIYNRPVVYAQVFKNIRYSVPNSIIHPNQLLLREGYWQWHNPVV